MFTWICPKCGREVPPAYNECPNCAQKEAPKGVATEIEPVPAALPPQNVVPAPPLVSAPIPVALPQPAYVPPPPPAQTPPSASTFGSTAYDRIQQVQSRKGLPSWLVAALAVVGVGAVLAILYAYILPHRKPDTVAAISGGAAAPMTSIPGANAPKTVHPLAKFLEIAGVRVSEDAKQQLHVHFVVVNHSGADLPELKMNVTVKAADKALVELPVTVPSIGPFESKDLEATAKSSLRGYELPDWQFLKADFEITSAP